MSGCERQLLEKIPLLLITVPLQPDIGVQGNSAVNRRWVTERRHNQWFRGKPVSRRRDDGCDSRIDVYEDALTFPEGDISQMAFINFSDVISRRAAVFGPYCRVKRCLPREGKERQKRAFGSVCFRSGKEFRGSFHVFSRVGNCNIAL